MSLAHTLNTWVWRVQLAPGARWELPDRMSTFVLAGELESENQSYTESQTIAPRRVARPVKANAATTILLVGNNAS
jgi:hypothetical protein